MIILNSKCTILQECVLQPGNHAFDTLTIQSGGKLLLKGDVDRTRKTTIQAQTIVIHPGGEIKAEANGYYTDGPGSGGSSGYGGSFGGKGGKVTESSYLYGDILHPLDYGSAGYGATSVSGGLGGSQIEIRVSDVLQNDGLIDVSGKGGVSSTQGGGSGGSIYVEAGSVRGFGQFLAKGGTSKVGGGGGGRVAFSTLDNIDETFNGLISVNGGHGDGQSGGSGE